MCFLSEITSTYSGAESWTLRKVDPKHLEVLKVVLKKDGEDQLDRSCEKLRSITWNQGGNGGSTYNKKKEG